MSLVDPVQLMIIGVIVVAVFFWGPQKIPQLARAIGSARREFESASKEGATNLAETSKSTRSAEQVLLGTARQLGIRTEGKTSDQISEEIIEKSK